ncbi:MAG TPA: c-type cytochrome [Chthonomonadaceae bacterium]|nr:c-type cytochrome [Chthonomonadaceae bacterium]
MISIPKLGKAGWLGLALTAAFFVLVGCSGNDQGSDAKAPAPPPKSDNATASKAAPPDSASTSGDPGQAVFNAKCAGCHTIGGGRKKGPDLAHVGGEAEHTQEWLTAFIKDPKSKDPGSRMPGFEGKITDDELKSLTAYLVTLK